MWRWAMLTCVLALAMGCGANPPSVTPPPANAPDKSPSVLTEPVDRETEILQVFETLFRHQFQRNASAVQQNAKGYFLTIDQQDPTPEFLTRFAGHVPPVRKGSEFAVEQEGVLFRVGAVKWIDDSTVEVHGGYYEGELSSSKNVYRLVRKDGKWVVERDQMLSIS